MHKPLYSAMFASGWCVQCIVMKLNPAKGDFQIFILVCTSEPGHQTYVPFNRCLTAGVLP